MTSYNTKVLIAAPTFQSEMQATLCEHLKKRLKPEEVILCSVTDETGEQKERLERALAQSNPSAMIAISIRPESDTISVYASKQGSSPICVPDV